jgi:hypothetical protein
MKLVVGEISATSYKKLVTRLRHLSKKQLWDVLDHYIFHVMNDQDVSELLGILNEKALEQQGGEITSSALDDDLFYAIDPKDRFMPPVIATVPTTEELEKFRDQLELLYDRNCFESYIEPAIKADVARKLSEFAEDSGIFAPGHWAEFQSEGAGQ